MFFHHKELTPVSVPQKGTPLPDQVSDPRERLGPDQVSDLPALQLEPELAAVPQARSPGRAPVAVLRVELRELDW